MLQIKRKATEPQLDIDAASKILENVFEISQVEPNTIPLDVLTAYSNYRRERFALQRTVLVVVMVLFMMIPFLFISPSFTIRTASGENTLNPVYEVNLDTFMPVERITATIDGRNIPVYETDTHVYTIEPALNGQMMVSITLLNNQTVTHFIDVENVDKDAPLVVSNKVDKENIYLYLSDTGTGIDYEAIKAVSISGQELRPAFYDTSAGCVAFAYGDESLNVYIPDYAGNELHLILTVK